MNRFDLPRPLPVQIETLDDTANGDRPSIPTHTVIFREGSYLPEALDMLYTNSPPAADLSVISAGCSSGAEVDSLLALHAKGSHAGKLALTGYDINGRAIEAANKGTYMVMEPDDSQKRERIRAMLSDLGFTLGDRIEKKYIGGVRQGYQQVGVQALRQTEKVAFEQKDLSQPLPKDLSADLIVANNVLIHFAPALATTIACNLASSLSDQGILSLGFMREEFKGRWGRELIRILNKDFFLKLVIPESTDQVAFAKA